MAQRKFVIVRLHSDEPDQTDYWNNDDGWGDLDSATMFDSMNYNLPDGGAWLENKTKPKRWQNALDIQSAVNPSGIAHALIEACTECREEGMGTDQIKDDPAVRLITFQLAYLMRTRELDNALHHYRQALEVCEAKAKETA